MSDIVSAALADAERHRIIKWGCEGAAYRLVEHPLTVHIRALAAEVERLREELVAADKAAEQNEDLLLTENDQLRQFALALAERVAAASEVLSRVAERQFPPLGVISPSPLWVKKHTRPETPYELRADWLETQRRWTEFARRAVK